MFDKEAPRWMKLLPLFAGGSYFIFSKYAEKNTTKAALGGAALYVSLFSLPWLFYTGGSKAPLLTSAATDKKGSAEPADMNKAVRQQMIDYVVAKDKSKLNQEENFRKALNTLTNNEMKALYTAYKFNENKNELLAKYGKAEGNDLTKMIADKEFNIDLSDVEDVNKTITTGMTKVMQAMVTQKA